MGGEQIDEKQLIDHHYYSIASKATLMEPKDLAVPTETFQNHFGVEWQEVLQGGRAMNAMQACWKLGCTADEMDRKWATARDNGKVVRFGGGFYCGEIEGNYVFNGFFMSMRAKYTGEAKTHYYVVQFDSEELSWTDFTNKVLGATDPSKAHVNSIRGFVHARWQQLGLGRECDMGDNVLHGSASPFEALAEITNWLECDISSQPFGRLLRGAGVSAKTIEDWRCDPQVVFPEKPPGTFSLFDLVEDSDTEACLDTLKKVNGHSA